jgi:hypothetical protein
MPRSVPNTDMVEGDFNGDHEKESAWVQRTGKDKNGEMIIQNLCTIRFSNEKITPLNTELYYVYGNIWNEGDLDGDGGDELALVVYNEKEWSLCYIYSLKKRSWYLLAEPFMVWGGLEDDDIQIVPGKKGHLQIKELVAHGDSLVPEIHTIRID